VDELKKQGYAGCALWTLEGNRRAQKAYERFGFVRDGTNKTYEFGGVPVGEIRYRMAIE
jgi:RimJ/RimL family protein N-acetyltransferase